MVQRLQWNEFRWFLTPSQGLYCRSSELSSNGSTVFNSGFEVWASEASHSVQVTVSSSTKWYLSLLCPSVAVTLLLPSHRCHHGHQRSQSRVFAALQLLQHQVIGNTYHTGCASRVRLQLQYPLLLSDAPDELSPGGVEHICSAAVPENRGKSRGERWDGGALPQGAMHGCFLQALSPCQVFLLFSDSMSPALPVPAMLHTAFHLLPWITSCSQACFVLPIPRYESLPLLYNLFTHLMLCSLLWYLGTKQLE